MNYEYLKGELKRMENMYQIGTPIVLVLQQARLAIIDMENEIKALNPDEQGK